MKADPKLTCGKAHSWLATFAKQMGVSRERRGWNWQPHKRPKTPAWECGWHVGVIGSRHRPAAPPSLPLQSPKPNNCLLRHSQVMKKCQRETELFLTPKPGSQPGWGVERQTENGCSGGGHSPGTQYYSCPHPPPASCCAISAHILNMLLEYTGIRS